MTVPLSPDEMLRSVQADIGPDAMLASVQDDSGPSVLGAVRQGLGGWGQGTMALLRAAAGTARRSGVMHNVPTMVESWPERRLREQERRIEESIGEPQGIVETGARIVGRMVPDAAAIAATGGAMGAALPALGALRGAAGVIARNAAAAPFDVIVGTGAPDQSGIQGLADLTGSETLQRVAESPAMPLAEAALGTALGSALEGGFRGIARLRRPRVPQVEPRPRMTPEEMRAVDEVVEQAPTSDELVQDMAEGRALQGETPPPVPEVPFVPETGPVRPGLDFSVSPPRPLGDAVIPGVPRDDAAVQEGLFGGRELVGSEQTALLPETAGVPTARLRETKIQPDEMARLAAERPSTDVPGETPLPLPLSRGGVTRRLPRDMAKWTDDELVARFIEINARLGKSGEQFNEGFKPWTRFDDDIFEQRSGTVVTNAAGRAIAATNRDADIMGRLLAEAERRNIDLLARGDDLAYEMAAREARLSGEGGFAVPALMRSIAGAGVGGAVGATQGDTPRERLRNAAMSAAAMGLLAAGLPAIRGRDGKLQLWHGTPHVFEPEPGHPLGRFRMDKIGTGEGAQAYGHGLYFAESPDVARFYRGKKGGSLYRVDVDASDADFLNFDAPIGEQSERIAALAAESPPVVVADGVRVGPNSRLRVSESLVGTPQYRLEFDDGLTSFALHPRDLPNLFGHGDDGKSLYIRLLNRYGSDVEVSRVLRDAGIKGIRYADATSRGGNADRWLLTTSDGMVRDFPTGEAAEAARARIGGTVREPSATYNYVLFTDEPVRITERGFAVPALMQSVAGAGLGATAGAAIDQEHPGEGALVGGLIGAGLPLAPRMFRGTPKVARTAAEAAESTRGLRAGVAEGTTALPARVEPTPRPATVSVTPEDAARYATHGGREAPGTGHTVLGFAVDDVDANARYTQLLQESVEDLRARGLDPKTREPWSEIQGSTVRDLGVSPSEVAGDIRHWDRATFEVARRWYRTGEARVKAITEQLAQARTGAAALPDEARVALNDELTRVMGEMRTLTSQTTRARSAFGRNLNFMKSVTRGLDDPFSWRIVAERIAGRDLSADELVKLDAAIRTSRHDAQVFIARLRPSSWQEQVSTFLKAMWLTVPATHVRNPLSTATHMAARTGADALVGEWVDRLASVYSGVRTKSLAGRMEGVSRRVWAEAKQNARNAMRGLDPAKAEAMDIPHLTNFGDSPIGRFTQTVTDGVFRALGAEDALLYAFAYRGAVAEQLTLAGKRAGKRGAALTGWVRQVMHDPPVDVASTAQEIALQAVFRDETGLARFITSGKRALAANHPNAKLVAEIVMPYVRTPASVLHKTLQFTPVGVATGAAKGRAWVNAIRSGDERAVLRFQREMVDGIARGTFGTAAMLGLGYWLYRQGAMTAGRPQSPADRAQWELEGRQPYSVKGPGDRWYRLTYMAPIGTVMAIGAAVAEATEQASAGETAKASRALSGASQTLLDVPMLMGTKSLLEAATDIGGAGERYLQNQAASAVPGVVGAIARTVDPTVRQPTGPGEAFMSRVPGLSQNVQPRLDVFGRPLRRDENVLIRAGRELFDPFRSTASRIADDPVTAELARIEAGVAPIRPRKGEEAEPFRARQVESGSAVYEALRTALAGSAYRTVLRNDEQRRDFVDAVVRSVRSDDPFNALETAWRVRRRQEREARQQ